MTTSTSSGRGSGQRPMREETFMMDPIRERKRRLAALQEQVASGPELPPDLSAALAAAFPGRPVRDVTSLSGGLSGATLIAFVVDGAPYVAKRVG
ncbi:hypothetical protein BE17_36520, partial [Sorangium cellulosum]